MAIHTLTQSGRNKKIKVLHERVLLDTYNIITDGPLPAISEAVTLSK